MVGDAASLPKAVAFPGHLAASGVAYEPPARDAGGRLTGRDGQDSEIAVGRQIRAMEGRQGVPLRLGSGREVAAYDRIS